MGGLGTGTEPGCKKCKNDTLWIPNWNSSSNNTQALYLSTTSVSRTLLGPMEGVERDVNAGESMGAVVEASRAKI
jgi:hypothetical protein